MRVKYNYTYYLIQKDEIQLCLIEKDNDHSRKNKRKLDRLQYVVLDSQGEASNAPSTSEVEVISQTTESHAESSVIEAMNTNCKQLFWRNEYLICEFFTSVMLFDGLFAMFFMGDKV